MSGPAYISLTGKTDQIKTWRRSTFAPRAKKHSEFDAVGAGGGT